MAEVETGLHLVALAERLAYGLARVTPCFLSGALLVHDHRGHMVIFRSRPVDDLFVQAVQQRLSLSYQMCVGPGVAEPDVQVLVHGESLSGPYEPPRSLLTMPVLCHGRVVGMVAIASVFAEAFSSQDLCAMSILAAQGSETLESADPDPSTQGMDLLSSAARPVSAQIEDPAILSSVAQASGPVLHGRLRCRVGQYLRAIVDLADEWRGKKSEPLPELLRQDLDAIAQNALCIQKLLVH